MSCSLRLFLFFFDHWSDQLFQNNQHFQTIEFLDQHVPEKLDMGFLFYGHELLQVECADSQVQSYPSTHPWHTRNVSVDFQWCVFGSAPLTHVNFNHVNKIEVRYKVLRLNVKFSEFLLLLLHNCTCDLSYFVSILFANANFTHIRT